MEVPSWANIAVSADLLALRQKGEGQEVEFKQELPPQLHDLGKDIAAFGSSGGGKVLIGIADNGTLVGLNLADGAQRDAFLRRVQGVAAFVRPAIRIDQVFGVECDKTVLCLSIPRQTEPVFYYDHRPYVRDGSISRPATPDEVKQLVWSHPSSEHKRFLEETKRKWIEMIQNDSQRFSDLSVEQQRINSRLLGQ